MKRRVVILGGGGHARVLIDALQLAGDVDLVGIVDADSSRWNSEMLGVPIVGGDDRLPALIAAGATHFVVGVAGIGPGRLRRQLYGQARVAGLEPLSVAHPSAIVSPWSQPGAGIQLLPGAIVNACAVLGDGVIINTGAIVEHDCLVGAFAHVASGARLAGNVTIGAGAFIGAGATVIQGLVIGEEALVGAGAVVVRDVPPATMVVGVPARPVAPRVTTKGSKVLPS